MSKIEHNYTLKLPFSNILVTFEIAMKYFEQSLVSNKILKTFLFFLLNSFTIMFLYAINLMVNLKKILQIRQITYCKIFGRVPRY